MNLFLEKVAFQFEMLRFYCEFLEPKKKYIYFKVRHGIIKALHCVASVFSGSAALYFIITAKFARSHYAPAAYRKSLSTFLCCYYCCNFIEMNVRSTCSVNGRPRNIRNSSDMNIYRDIYKHLLNLLEATCITYVIQPTNTTIIIL